MSWTIDEESLVSSSVAPFRPALRSRKSSSSSNRRPPVVNIDSGGKSFTVPTIWYRTHLNALISVSERPVHQLIALDNPADPSYQTMS